MPEEERREGDLPWLRLSVQTGTLRGGGDEATEILDRAQAAELRDAITDWLAEAPPREGVRPAPSPEEARELFEKWAAEEEVGYRGEASWEEFKRDLDEGRPADGKPFPEEG